MKYFLFLFILLIVGCKSSEEHYARAQCLEKFGHHKRAFYAINKAIRKSPGNYQYYILRAQTRYRGWVTKKASIEKVLADYNKALQYKPFALEVYKARWKYFEFENDEKRMLIDLQNVLNKDSINVEAWLKIGSLNFNNNDTTKGYYCFNKAYEYANNKDSVLTFLADAEFNAKLFKKAKNRYIELLKRSDKVNFYRYHYLSMSYWNMNNRDSACFYFQYVNKKYLFDKLPEINAYCN